jgi:hypothetical protein
MIKDAAETGKKFRDSLSYKNSPMGKFAQLNMEKRGLLSRPRVGAPNIGLPAVGDPRPQPHHCHGIGEGRGQIMHELMAKGYSREDVEKVLRTLLEKGKKIKSVNVSFEFEKE